MLTLSGDGGIKTIVGNKMSSQDKKPNRVKATIKLKKKGFQFNSTANSSSDDEVIEMHSTKKGEEQDGDDAEESGEAEIEEPCSIHDEESGEEEEGSTSSRHSSGDS